MLFSSIRPHSIGALCLPFGLLLSLPSLGNAQASSPGAIDQRLNDLRQIAQPPLVSEIPTDESAIPADWLGIVSWNVQVGGVSTSTSAARPPMVGTALQRMFSGSYQILAAQEVSSAANAEVLTNLLPAGSSRWKALFTDTDDSQDNGFWYSDSVSPSAFSTLFIFDSLSAAGRRLVDETKTTHPPAVAHFALGDFDFTLITVHLTFADGRTAESVRELSEVLSYVDWYFQQPGHDPDVIICGDFNTPSRLSGQSGDDGIVLDAIFEDDPRFQVGERRLVATVHEPTSRSSAALGGLPRNNYDHFILSADTLEEFIQARRVDTQVLTANPDDPEARLTSDHFPVVALFRTVGPGVQLDGVAKPGVAAITSVVDGASFREGISAGSWISIFGSDLAPTTRVWRDDEIVDGVLPTELDGIRVMVNGKPAAVYFVSPGQLNVESPDDPTLGPVKVELQRDGATVATANTEMRHAAPGLFTFDPQGRRYLAAVHTDGTFVGPAGLFGPAVATRPAKPGDTVLLFGTGFGPTSPPVAAGQVFGGAAPLMDAVKVLFGGIQGGVYFAGLSGAGLNQINVKIPSNVPSGDVEVVAEVAGVQTQPNAFLRIEGLPAAAPTVAMAASKTKVQPGESTLLQWSSTNAQSVVIAPGIGSVNPSGSMPVKPSAKTTYTITAAGPGGTATASVTIDVVANAPTVTLTASRQSIQSGQSATLQWSATNAQTVSISPGIGPVGLTGTRTVLPAATTTYTITAVGPGGSATASVRIEVTAPPAAPTVSFAASPQSIQSGQSSTLQWTTSDATSVSISQGIGSVAASGSRLVSPSQTTTYTITATGTGGTRTSSAKVTVTSAPSSDDNFGPCGSKTKCGEMTSCAEAKFYLNVCKVNRLDGDSDGTPCESICGGG